MEENKELVLIHSKSKLNIENIKVLKNVFKFIVFDVFVLAVFFITSYELLLALLLINIFAAKKLKLKVIHMIQYLEFLIPIIIITLIINVLVINIEYAILIMTRFIIACTSTYIFSKTITVLEISKVIETILSPFKLLKVDVRNIGLLVSISISFIPILKDELFELKQILESKGYVMKVSNVYMYIRPLVISIFKRASEIEKAIVAKGYIES